MSNQTATQMQLKRHFHAPPGEVFRAFVDPDRLAQWFGPAGFHVPRATVQVDTRVGGLWRLVMVNNDVPVITSPVDLVFTEVVPGRRLVGYEDAKGMAGVRDGTRLVLVIEFDAAGDGTLLTVTQGPFPPELSEMGSMGWRQSFRKLEALLDGPAHSRTAMAG